MSTQDFKYVIQTELKITPGSLNKLLEEVKQLDTQLKDRVGVIGVRAKFTGNSIRDMKEQLNKANFEATVKLKLDKASLEEVERQVRHLKLNAPLSVNPNSSTGTNNAPVTPAQAQAARRVGSGLGAQAQQAQANSTKPVRLNAETDPKVVAARVEAYNARVKWFETQIRLAEERNARQAQRSAELRAREAQQRLSRAETQRQNQERDFAIHASKKLGPNHDVTILNQRAKELADFNRNLGRSVRLNRNYPAGRFQFEQEQQRREEERLQSNLGRSVRIRRETTYGRYLEREQLPIGRATRLNTFHPARLIQEAQAELRKQQEELEKAVANGSASKLKTNHPAMILQAQAKAAAKAQEELEKAIANSTASRLGRNHPAVIMQNVARIAQSQQSAEERAFANNASSRLGRNHRAVILAAEARRRQREQESEQQRLDRAIANHASSRLGANHPAVLMQRVGSGNTNGFIQGLEAQLLQNSVPLKEKANIIAQLTEEYKRLARASGQNITKSFEFTDESGRKIRTTTKEFTHFGDVVEKGTKSFRNMVGTVAKNAGIYSVVTAGFAAISAGIIGSVSAMADFETQFVKIQNIADARSSLTKEQQEQGITVSPTAVDSEQAKRSIFSLGKKYGLNPTSDVAPIYTEFLRRKDIAPEEKQVRQLTQLVVRSGVAMGGADIQGDDLRRIGDDFTSVYSQMFKVWTENGGSADVAIRKMGLFVDSLAEMDAQGANFDKSLDALADLTPYATGSERVDLNLLAAIVATAQHQMQDSSGQEISSALKMYFGNLTNKDPKNLGSAEARRMLGVDDTATLGDMLPIIRDKVGGLNGQAKWTAGDIRAFAASLASSAGGSSGAARSPQNQKITESMVESFELYTETLNAQGKAEQMALKASHTLRGEWQRMLATMQELAVSLGDSGVLNGLKFLVKGLNALASGLNVLLSSLGKLRAISSNAFGEQVGGGAYDIFATALMGTVGLTAGRKLYGKYFGKGKGSALDSVGSTVAEVADIASLVVPDGDVNRSTRSRRVGRNTRISRRYYQVFRDVNGGSDYYNDRGGYTRNFTTRVGRLGEQGPSRFSRIGSTIGNGAEAIWSFLSFRSGPGSFARSTSTAAKTTGIIEKLVSGFSAIIGPLKTFGAILARLSIWGAAIGVAVWGVSKLYKMSQEGKRKDANSFNDLYSTQEGTDLANSKFARARELIDQYSPVSKDASENEIARARNNAQDYLLKLYESPMGKENNDYKDAKEFHDIIQFFNGKGIKLTGGKALEWKFRYNDFLEGEDGKSGKLKQFDTDNVKAYDAVIDSILNKTGTLSSEWEKNNKGALDYAKTLRDIENISESFNSIAQIQTIQSALNNVRFSGGGENSAAFYQNELANAEKTMSMMASRYDEIMANKKAIDSDSTLAALNLENASMTLQSLPDGENLYKSMIEEFNSAKESGSLYDFTTRYDSRDVNQKSEEYAVKKAQYDLAKTLVDQESSTQGLEKSKKLLEELTSSISNQITSLKQLAIAYEVASTGIDTFDGALRKVDSALNRSQTLLNIANTDESKKKAMGDVFSNLATEARLYSDELSTIQNRIKTIIADNPDTDFSLGALYNPTDELNINQATVKQLMEKGYEVSSSQNANLEALKSQVDAMKDLVLNSDKYKAMWDSVNERIQLSQSLVKQLSEINTGKSVEGFMSTLRSNILGSSFNKGDYAKQQSESRRDSYLDITEQIKKSLVTYGDDAQKLKEALAEINGSYTDKIKTAFLEPLKDIIGTDFANAGQMQTDAAKTMQDSINVLQLILDSNLKALEDVIAKINGEPITPEVPTTSSDNSNLNLGKGPINNATALAIVKKNQSNPFNMPLLPGSFANIKPTATTSSISSAAPQPTDMQKIYNINPATGKTYDFASSASQIISGQQGSTDATVAQLVNKSLKLQTNVTAEELNAWIDSKTKDKPNSVMKGMGEAFIKAAQESGLDPVYLLAHAAHETGWGTSKIARNKSNFFGIGAFDASPYASSYGYDSDEAGIVEGAKWISKFYANGKYDQDTLSKMRFNGGIHQYATDSGWATKIAKIMTGFSGGVALTGKESTVIPVVNDAPQLEKDNTEADAKAARDQLIQSAKEAIVGAFTSQKDVLLGAKDSIKSNYSSGIQDYVSKMTINGQGRVDFNQFKQESLKNARIQVADAIKANEEFTKNAPQQLKDLKAQAAAFAKQANDKSLTADEQAQAKTNYDVTKAQFDALYGLLKDGKYIEELKKNTANLKILADRYANEAKKDPTKNTKYAQEEIQKSLQLVAEYNRKGKVGSVDYYDQLQQTNTQYSSYMNTKKKTDIVQEFFDNSGMEYGQLAKLKNAGFDEDVTLLFKKMNAVAKVLRTFTEGTNEWYTVLEDAVALQQQIVDMENKKTEVSKQYFELTGGGLNGYINARAYQQGRDITRANSNMQTAAQKYRSNASNNYSENLVNLQVVSEMYDQVQQQMDSYRNAVTGAFRAGVLSITEYIKKLQELRNVQQESKDQAIQMSDSIQSTFQSSLADALKSGFEGNFDASLDFTKNIKSGLASAISSQMSTVMLTQSGLMDTVNGLMASIISKMTTGNPNDAVNLFNNMDLGSMLDDALAPFLPLIQSITDSSNGIFGILSDNVYNAPSGFKIDSYLYEMQKPLTYADVMGSSASPTNEAGAPVTTPRSSGGTIVLPPTSTPIGSGYQDVLTNPAKAIDPVGSGSQSTPFTKSNPVADILSGLITMKELYMENPNSSSIKNMTHEEAEKLRDSLSEIPGAEAIAAAIGDGSTGMTLEQMRNYLSSMDLSQFDVVNGIDGLSSTTGTKLDGVITGISNVVGAVNSLKLTGSTGSTSSSGTYTSGTVNSIPSGVSNTGTASTSYTGSSGSSSSKSTSTGMMDTGTATSSSSSSSERGTVQIKSPWNGAIITVYEDSILNTPANREGVPQYHTGGIAGVMNFLNGSKLKNNEIASILQREEIVFQKGQLGSFFGSILSGYEGASNMMGMNTGIAGGLLDRTSPSHTTSGSSSNRIDLNITIQGNTTGTSDEVIKEAVSEGVAKAVAEVQRQNRLNLLRSGGPYRTAY